MNKCTWYKINTFLNIYNRTLASWSWNTWSTSSADFTINCSTIWLEFFSCCKSIYISICSTLCDIFYIKGIWIRTTWRNYWKDFSLNLCTGIISSCNYFTYKIWKISVWVKSTTNRVSKWWFYFYKIVFCIKSNLTTNNSWPMFKCILSMSINLGL